VTHTTSLTDLLAAFRARYTEFDAVGVTVMTNALIDARLQTDPAVFGAADDLACMALAAHLIVMSPGGNPMRIKVDGNPTSTYKADYDRMVLQYAPACRPVL
jgi:hypothetical protein